MRVKNQRETIINDTNTCVIAIAIAGMFSDTGEQHGKRKRVASQGNGKKARKKEIINNLITHVSILN